MRVGNKECALVKCPFYKDIKEKRIRCEEIDRKVVSFDFKTADERDMYLVLYCEDSYKRCPLYKMLTARFEDG